MSTNLSRLVQPFVTSVVVGKDVVPRVSVVNLGRLIDQMVNPFQQSVVCERPARAVRMVTLRCHIKQRSSLAKADSISHMIEDSQDYLAQLW